MFHKGKLHPLTFTGMVLLIPALISQRIHLHTASGQDMADAFSGLLLGLSIGCMLFGMWKSRRPNRDVPPSQGG